jgi:hypothetical protein
MPRTFLFLASLIIATAMSSTGCRSCDSCSDYSPPVANCGCGSCPTQRAGSASGGYANDTYYEGDVQQQGSMAQ